MVLNATFNNISVILWRAVLLVEETGVLPWENHRAVPSNWQTLSHNVVSSTPRHEQGRLYNEKTTQDQQDYQAYHGKEKILKHNLYGHDGLVVGFYLCCTIECLGITEKSL